jgi:putative ABC transport system permease protein
VIVNQEWAETYFPGQDPIGKQIHDFAELEDFTRTSYSSAESCGSAESLSGIFSVRSTASLRSSAGRFFTLVLRTDGDPRLFLPVVQKVVSSIDPDVPLSDLNAFEGVISKTFEIRRLALLLVGLFSFFALTSSAVGVYGVLARLVSLRIRDIGIRIALGARVSDVIGLVFLQGLKIVCVGLVFGIVIALVLGRFLTGFVYGISSSEPATVGLVVLVLSVAALLACLLPALRATRINPIVALKE